MFAATMGLQMGETYAGRQLCSAMHAEGGGIRAMRACSAAKRTAPSGDESKSRQMLTARLQRLQTPGVGADRAVNNTSLCGCKRMAWAQRKALGCCADIFCMKLSATDGLSAGRKMAQQ